MTKHILSAATDRKEILEHIAKFVHDIRTPLLGATKYAENASNLLSPLLPATDLPTDSECATDQLQASEKEQLILNLESIETYAKRSDEIVNEFWAQTLTLLNDSTGDESSQPVVEARSYNKTKLSNEHKQALLVDDNEFNQQVGFEMLRELGFKVTIANNGIQALELLESDNFHFVLMDCRLPQMDGWETTIEIRKRQRGSGIPIVGLTASLDENDHKRAVEAGMNDCLSKPLTINTLERIVDIYVN